MENSTQESAADPGTTADRSLADAVDAIDIQVVFEVGRSSIPLSTLRSLKPGYVFALNTPVEQPVSIQANGKTLGRGELLDVDGQLAVRMLEAVDG